MSGRGQHIDRVVIVGGGTAGWMTAAALGRMLGALGLSITLVESASIGTVGVGEATLPQIRTFNRLLGIDEAEMMARTAATIKLGIEFRDWGRPGDHYIHPFGTYGEELGDAPFIQYWARASAMGAAASIGEYSLPIVAALAGRFEPPSEDGRHQPYDYAFQFDAGLYAAWLAELAQAAGVIRREGRIVAVRREGESGQIGSVLLETGETIDGDLFIDCSGFRALLIGDTLGSAFEDWSHWLPCNRAFAVPCGNGGDHGPYTRATARRAGWQWRIPLQHRVGNGLVYCNDWWEDQAACDFLMAHLESDAGAEPRQLSFSTGRRKSLWSGNCIAIGLAGGFLEPLESTSIDLIQSGILNLVELFPGEVIEESDRAEYNRLMDLEFERIRDFLVLHYVANQREEEFWSAMREMAIPQSLSDKIEDFRTRAILPEYAEGLFQPVSWISVFLGQNVVPQGWDPRTDALGETDLAQQLEDMRQRMAADAGSMPTHLDYIRNAGASFPASIVHP
ncbi:tryptophan halogenase family protein [Erythrobacter sp.]|uniref:tryptophan halogenase family protein n=1 Tax=Erythrobacter sp. TaxID=1042 RepID=UPI001B00695A|nr:tryptophan halogenase family protein [Erythrobacter sp.]MBO6526852.1 tryptophan 7-halogenase [Erythrobacter sp.]MBO6528525.1 tryptophan 7-halogenase [Erythrobacter sp.]